MEKVRNNIFNLINKGLRAAIYETGLLVQQMQLNDCCEAQVIFERIKEVINFSLLRAQHIEKTIFGFLPESGNKAVEDIKRQHGQIRKIAADILDSINNFDETKPELSHTIFSLKLTGQFYDFSSSSLFFLNSEEHELKRLLISNYDDDTLCALGKELMCYIDAGIKPMVFKWVIRGTSDTEIIRLLNTAKLAAPASELEQLMWLAETELSEKRWMRVQEGLQDGLCL